MIVRPSEYEWIEGIGRYFFIIKDINELIFSLKNMQDIPVENVEEISFKICIQFERVFPTIFDIEKENTKVKITKASINNNNGILLLKNKLPFLLKKYDDILQANQELIYSLKKIRNKYEHEPHLIRWKSLVPSKLMLSDIEFVYNEYRYYNNKFCPKLNKNSDKSTDIKKFNINFKDFIKIMINLNSVYKEIQEMWVEELKVNNDFESHPYTLWMKSINLDKYNSKLNKYLKEMDNV